VAEFMTQGCAGQMIADRPANTVCDPDLRPTIVEQRGLAVNPDRQIRVRIEKFGPLFV
jgi:hypothetical protein